jgi:N-formylglutamate amidohydrolase
MILHIPHSSTRIPSSATFIKNISDDLFRMTDHRTDELFAFSATSIVRFGYSRLFCDVERFVDNEPMEQYGHGLCYTKDSFGNPLRNLTSEQRQYIIDNFYTPHHTELSIACNSALSLFDTVVLVDCHSFSDTVLPHESDTNRPDFCLGTDSFHTPIELVNSIKSVLEDLGYTVAINSPFAGTIVPKIHYQKTEQLKSIMIEVNRKLYMNNNADFAKTKSAVDHVLTVINNYEQQMDNINEAI